MATPAQRTNTWILDQWYDQAVAGTQGSYTGEGQLFVWGKNNAGSLGLNQAHQSYSSSPVQIPGAWGANSQLRAKRSQMMVFKTDGTLWTWGANNYGQLGQNNTTQRSSPVTISGTTWSTGTLGEQSATAIIRTDGTLWTFGLDSNGQLGQNSHVGYQSPKQVGTNTTWSQVAGGEGYFLATKTDGTLWSWGENNEGMLGQNNKTQRSSPIQIPGTTWDQVGAIRDSCFARKTDGTLWTWGVNGGGQLGHNNKTGYSSPRQVPGTTWASLPIGTETGSSGPMIATKTDGTLWVCGEPGDYGVLGLNAVNNPASRSSPTQVGTDTNWSTTLRPTSSGRGASAMRSDGTAWVWGSNTGDEAGMLGLNDQVSRSSPTQIPGTDWKNLTVSIYGSCGIREG